MPHTRTAQLEPKAFQAKAGDPLFLSIAPALPPVVKVNNGRPLLRPGPFLHRTDIYRLDYIEACPHGKSMCPYCLQNGQQAAEIRVAANVGERIIDELLALAHFPRAALVSSNTDPFPPLADVQQETASVVDVLTRNGIECWLMTRGFIRPAMVESFARRAAKIKVTIGMTTLDRTLQRTLEPWCASPNLRVKSVSALRDSGISCSVALEPLIPSVTDTRDNLMPVLEALATAGVRSVTVGYLVLDPRMEQQLETSLRPLGLDTMVLDEYARSSVLRSGSSSSARYLPRSRRQHGYSSIMAMAAGLGLRVSVNALSNPDFTATHIERRRTARPFARLNAG